MSNNEIVKINPNNSLVKVSNLISLTNKLLNEVNSAGIVLYNLSEYNLQRKTEIAFISFIKKHCKIFLSVSNLIIFSLSIIIKKN